MSEPINIYCDESCHLQHDASKVMVLGAVWCPESKAREIAVRMREIRAAHKIPRCVEIKWTKVSPAQVGFYQAIIDYFFDDDDLHFRGLVVPDKTKLRHEDFGQDHDTWYFKMYFQLLTVLFNPDTRYRVYLDVKDTASAAKIKNLHDILCSSRYDFNRQIIDRVEAVRSHDVEQIQLCDLLAGALAAVNRGDTQSPAKKQLIARIRERSGLQLTRNTLPRARKVNVLVWEPQAG